MEEVEFPAEAMVSGSYCRAGPGCSGKVSRLKPRSGPPPPGLSYTAALSAAKATPDPPSSKVTPIHVAQRLRRRPTRRHHVSLRPAVPAGPSRLRCSYLDRRDLAGHRDLRLAVCRPHVCNRSGLPPLFLPSGFCDRPGISVHPGLACAKHRAEKRFVVGGQASTSSSAFRYRRRRAFTASSRLPL